MGIQPLGGASFNETDQRCDKGIQTQDVWITGLPVLPTPRDLKPYLENESARLGWTFCLWTNIGSRISAARMLLE